MHANRTMLWGSNKSSTVPDLEISKGTEFSTSGLSQTVPFCKGQQMPSTEMPALRHLFDQSVAWQGTLTLHYERFLVDTLAIFFSAACEPCREDKGGKKTQTHVLRLGLDTNFLNIYRGQKVQLNQSGWDRQAAAAHSA